MTDVHARCLIVSANRVIIPYPVYPLGAACLVGSLQKNGHEAIHFDLLADGGLAELAKLLRTRTFDLIGVSIRNLDSVDSAAPQHYLDDIVETMHCIRQNSSSPVVLGGPGWHCNKNSTTLFSSRHAIVPLWSIEIITVILTRYRKKFFVLKSVLAGHVPNALHHKR